MELIPKLPPGRANRKALAFSSEIQRLRIAGYSFEAIRLALRDAGVTVSRTTVKREAAKGLAVARTSPQAVTPQPPAVRQPSSPSLTSALLPAPTTVSNTTSFAGDSRSGREIAEAFFTGRIDNPLIRERMEDEARRD
jgi:hypothetical protein